MYPQILAVLIFVFANLGLDASPNDNLSLLQNKLEHAKTNDERIELHLQIGLNYYYTGDLINSTKHSKLAEASIMESTNKLLQGRVYLYKGNFLLEQGEYGESLESLRKSYELFSERKINQQMATVLSSMAIVFERLNNLELALEYNRKVIKYREELNDTAGLAKVYTSMGNIYESLEKYDLALNYYQEALDIDSTLNNLRDLSVDYNNLGFLFYKLGQVDKAEGYYLKSYKIDEASKDRFSQSIVLLNLSKVYFKQNKFDRAYHSAQKALKFGQESQATEHLAACYEILSEIETKRGNTEDSYFYFKQFTALSDSIRHIKNKSLHKESLRATPTDPTRSTVLKSDVEENTGFFELDFWMFFALIILGIALLTIIKMIKN
jgi:tetratricopeptide (TPR) repeat protein